MKALRIAFALALIAGLSVGVAGCGSDDVAAIVNGEEISMEEFDTQVETLIEQYPQMFEGPDGEGQLLEFKQRLLDNMINNVLIRQAAEDRGVEVTDAEVEEQITQLKAGFQSDEQFEQALSQAGMDVEALGQQVSEQLMTERLIESLTEDTEVTEAEVQEYYDANTEQFKEEAAVHASHILFNPEDKAQAEEVLAEIEAGGDFAALATEYSQDPGSAANGGDLGWPTTPYVPEFQAAADELEVGEVSDLVETNFGWHIIRVEEKRDDRQKTLDEVSEQIEQIIVQQRNADVYQEFLNELRSDAQIEVFVVELSVPVDPATDPALDEPAEETAPEETE